MRRLGQGQHGVPANLSNEDIIREFETDYLVRPSFSTWTTAKSHQLRSLGGATLAVSGLFGCAWISWCDQGSWNEANLVRSVLSPEHPFRNVSREKSGESRLTEQMVGRNICGELMSHKSIS